MVDFFDCNYWVSSEISKEELKIVKDANIKKTIITNRLSLQYDSMIGNDEMLQREREENIFYALILVPEIYFLLDFKQYIKDAIEKGVRLFRFFPKSHLFNINDYYMEKIFDFFSSYALPVMLDLKQFDITGNKYFAIDDMERVIAKNPHMPVILETSLKQCFFNRIFFPLLEKYENLYIETSDLLLMDQIENMVQRFGPKRFIFGTGFPTKEVRIGTERLLYSQMDDFSKSCISFNNLDHIVRSIAIG